MDKRGATDNQLFWYMAYFLLGAIPFFMMLYWIVGLQDGAATWEDFYAKEIARVINSASPGEIFYLDVSKGAGIGFEKGLTREQMFIINNEDNSVRVQLSQRSASQVYYLKDIEIERFELEVPSNRLFIKFGGVA